MLANEESVQEQLVQKFDPAFIDEVKSKIKEGAEPVNETLKCHGVHTPLILRSLN